MIGPGGSVHACMIKSVPGTRYSARMHCNIFIGLSSPKT